MYKFILKNLIQDLGKSEISIYKNESDDHPLRNGKPHFIFSVENPKFPTEHNMSHQETLNELKSKNFKVHDIKGRYDGKDENSIMVEDPAPSAVKSLLEFAKKSGQESAIYSDGKGNHECHYLHGDKANKHVKGFGTSTPITPPDDNFSTMKDGTMFAHSIDWDNLYPKDRSMLRQHFRQEKLLKNEHIRKVYIPFALNKSEETGKETTLIHYSPKQGLSEISPAFHGERKIGMEAKHGAPENKLAFFYREGAKPEDLVTTGSLSKYVTKLDKGHRLYDIGEDGENVRPFLKAKADMKQINPGSVTNDDLHEELKKRGYHGFFNSKSSLPDAIAMFHSMPVHEEQELHPNDFKVASAKNHTSYDKALKTAQDTGHEDPHFLANLSTSLKNV